jgi:hypothetical protein
MPDAGRPVTRAYRPPRPGRERAPERKTGWRAAAAILFIFDLGLAAWLWVTDPSKWPVGVAIAVIPLLVLATAPILVWAARTETRFDLGGLLATGLLLRFAASFYRFEHAADASSYHLIGSNLAESFRHFDFAVDAKGSLPGTGGMNYVTGLVEVVTNGNKFATFLVFSWLGFIGCFLLYRAFATALPDADHRRYALLIFLWPTLLFWPSSVGKDCWMIFTLGIGALGAARVLVRRPGGYSLLAVGLLAGSVVRPHVSLIELVAFALAFLVGRQPDHGSGVTPGSLAKVAGLVVLVVLGGVLAERFGSVVGSADITDVNAVLAINQSRTDLGGSAFAAADPTNPVGYAEAVVTVLFRPFPTETGGLEQTAAAIEALALWCIVVASWRRLFTVPARLRRQPYVTFALLYLAMFIFGFGTIGNFGILARQRSQAIPFVFVLLSVSSAYERAGRGPGRRGKATSTNLRTRSSTSRAVTS